MLPIYMICWRNLAITMDCLESFISTATEPIELTVVNPNDSLPNTQTTEIRLYLRKLIEEGKVKRALFFDENVFGWGLIESVKDFPPQTPLFMMTDGDLIIRPDTDWIGLSKKYHDEGWAVTGFQLSIENYKSPNHGFSQEDCNFGLWGVMFSTQWFNTYHGTERNSIDSNIMNSARWTGGAIKVREIEVLHATWSISYEGDRYYDREYADFKRQQASNWVFNPKPNNMHYELIQND